MAWLDAELERLFAPDYLHDLHGRSLDELRVMRAECNKAETAVSYLRRVAQGRLDIVHSVIERSSSGSAELADLVEELPAIIGGGPPRPAGYGRLPAQMSPDVEVADLTSEIDGVLDVSLIAELPDMEEPQLRSIAEQLIEMEARISQQRRALHERIDAVQAEIVSRYKSGQASPDGLLA